MTVRLTLVSRFDSNKSVDLDDQLIAPGRFDLDLEARRCVASISRVDNTELAGPMTLDLLGNNYLNDDGIVETGDGTVTFAVG